LFFYFGVENVQNDSLKLHKSQKAFVFCLSDMVSGRLKAPVAKSREQFEERLILPCDDLMPLLISGKSED
jgi:hypothetical protein